ncbi:MAG: glycosyltransferase family 9 protein [Alphaproteobacteria bacterium]
MTNNIAKTDRQQAALQEANQLWQKVNDAVANKNFQAGLPHLSRLLFLASPTPEVWHLAASVHLGLKNYAMARVFAQQAVDKSKRTIQMLRFLFGVLYDQLDFRSAEKVLIELLARSDLDGLTHAACHYDYSILMRRFHNSQKSVEEIAKVEEKYFSQLQYFFFHRMFAYMVNREWRQGFAYFESRFDFHDFPIFRKMEFQKNFPRWDQLKNKDKNNDILYVVDEQGFGDFLQFARFLPLIKTKVKYLAVAAQKPLVRLIQTSPCGKDITIVPSGVYPENMTAWLPIASLPHVLADDLADKKGEIKIPAPIPYLACQDSGLLTQTPLAQTSAKKKIGLIWSSGPGAIDHHVRSLSLKDFLPLFAIKQAEFYSLQLQQAKQQIFQESFQSIITDLSPWINDFHSTAELMMGLDLIISVDTAGVHLAAGLGRPTILLCPFEGAWRFIIGNKGIDHHLRKDGYFHDMPHMEWYPDVDVIFPDNPYHWHRAIEKLVVAVINFIARTPSHDG